MRDCAGCDSNTDYEGEIKNSAHGEYPYPSTIVILTTSRSRPVGSRPSSNLVVLQSTTASTSTSLSDDVIEVQSDIDLMNIWRRMREQMKIAVDTSFSAT